MNLHTKKTNTKCICPKCGHEFDAEVYPVINVTENPELKEQVRQFKLFDAVCDKCKAEFDLGYSTTYINEAKKLVIVMPYVSYRDVGSREFTEITESMCPKDNDTKGFLRRETNSLYELREIIDIVDCGLDDRIVMLLKNIIMRKHKHEDSKIVYISFFREDDGKPVFATRYEDNTTSFIDFPQEAYENYKKKYIHLFKNNNTVMLDIEMMINSILIKENIDI